jgi:ribose transport system ATP-binding protein
MNPRSTKTAPALSIRGLCKAFGGAQALKDVDIDVQPGEVHGLLGENGSGKSTLIKVLAGFHSPDAGHLEVRGEAVRLPLAPGQFRALGMEFVHQDLGLIPSVSVLENLLMGHLATQRGPRRIRWRSERQAAAATLNKYGVHLDVTAKVQDLRPVEQALVAIVRGVEDMTAALAESGHSEGVLFLDEPTAFLPRDQVDQLFELIRRIVATGASVVLVSHDLDEVRRITDRVTVLRNGSNVGTVATAQTSILDLTKLIVGKELQAMERIEASRSTIGAAVLSTQNLSTTSIDSLSMQLRAGEVLGVTGLVGSGFEEIPYALFGSVKVDTGTINLFGRDLDNGKHNPLRAMQHGLGLIPGNRQREGSIPSLPMSDNLMQLSIANYFRTGFLRLSALRRDAARLMDTYDVRPRDSELSYGSFSGGNQQKALMAKWLEQTPKVLLLHEPTQGVDVGARLMILSLVRQAAADGAGVICASSDYEQLALICDRVLVLSQGQVHCELTGDEITKENITEQCLLSASPLSGQLQNEGIS